MSSRMYLVMAALVLLSLLPARAAHAVADRYGGVWHAGVDDGPFVPATAGMSFADLLLYQHTWAKDGYRMIDFEIARSARGCKPERDVFASKWIKGNWSDRITLYSSIHDFKAGLASQCEEGYVLEDFEIWGEGCKEVRYLALYRQGTCEVTEDGPVVAEAGYLTYSSLVAAWNTAGHYLVDFEARGPLDPASIVGVFYPGKRQQSFQVWSRPGFEAKMKEVEGSETLMDMESFRITPSNPEILRWRAVAGLWEDRAEGNADDHEVGEVLGGFEQLLFMESKDRFLADFELHQNTVDERFADVFRSYLGKDGGGWSLSVWQSGEEVAAAADGDARRNITPHVAMQIHTPGPVASVTKFFTALGVLTYAETQAPGWIDQPITGFLPPDFVGIHPQVMNVTFRDLLTQRSGLKTFSPSVTAVSNPAIYRQDMIAWLGEALADSGPSPVWDYQNVHFELLLIIMDEVVLPQNSPTPWETWMNQEVFAKAGMGPRDCAPDGGSALSYAWEPVYGVGQSWMPTNWPCNGYGSGAGMYWASARDIARISAAVRDGQIVGQPLLDDIFDSGFGLDHTRSGWAPYGPWTDNDSTTTGEEAHSKNGGLMEWDPADDRPRGTETFMVRWDDFDADDDCGCAPGGLCTGCPSQTGDEYAYELGYRGFDIGTMIHMHWFLEWCKTDDQGNVISCPPRQYPRATSMIREAMRLPERW